MDGKILGIVEAKKLTLGPQNVLSQAERYAKGLTGKPFDFRGFGVPFLYSTNGEVIWHHDIRHELNRSHQIAHFHTPQALAEFLQRDLDKACEKLNATPNDHALIRPYQKDANQETEKAIAERKRQMLIAMATGTGKTFTMVNQIYRLMEAGVAKRILFLVDRRALAAQAVRAFASFEPKPGLKFDKIYEVYSQRTSQPCARWTLVLPPVHSLIQSSGEDLPPSAGTARLRAGKTGPRLSTSPPRPSRRDP
jgi:type I restriction enzyme, R subunit